MDNPWTNRKLVVELEQTINKLQEQLESANFARDHWKSITEQMAARLAEQAEKMDKLEVSLYEEYDKKLQNFKEMFVTKADEYLDNYLKDLTAKEVALAIANGLTGQTVLDTIGSNP